MPKPWQRFNFGLAGLLIWTAMAILGTASDTITWGWMLGFKQEPVIFAEKPYLLALLHLAVTFSVSLPYLLLLSQRQEARFWAIVSLVVSAVLPAIGPTLCAAAWICCPSPPVSRYQDDAAGLFAFSRRHTRTRFLDEVAHIEETSTKRDEDYDLLKQTWLDLEPFEDILHGQDFLRKRNALGKIAQAPSAWSIVLIRKCLDDPMPDIRFHASSALNKIEDGLTKSLTRLQNELEATPDAAGLRARLAAQYLATAELRFFPRETERFYLRQGEELVRLLPPTPEHVLLHARLLAAQEAWPEAEALLAAQAERSPEMVAIYADALLHLGRMADLRQLRRQMPAPELVKDPKLHEAFAYWTHAVQPS